jgi:hypothetical protein
VMLEGSTVLSSDGQLQRSTQYCRYTQEKMAYNECFFNSLTLDEKEYLASRVLHLFFRALASELPFIFLSDAVTALEHYYSPKKYFEQTLDLYVIKADVAMTVAAAQSLRVWDIVQTLILVGEYLETTAVVSQDHIQAGHVYDFIIRSFSSKVSFESCTGIHQYNMLLCPFGMVKT